MPKNFQTLDTNILLSLILNDEPSQRPKSVALILNGANYYVPTLAITEAVFVMERGRRIDRKDIVTAISTLLDNSVLSYDRELIDVVFPFYISHPKLSFNDCIIAFEAAKYERGPVWTFDKDFAKQSAVAQLIQ